jgi:hypothetical protein
MDYAFSLHILLKEELSILANTQNQINALDAGFYIVQIKVNNTLIIRNFIKL